MIKTIKDIDIKNKRVLIRCDFNVPMKDLKILDDTRIEKSLETIKYCLKENAKIILFSHLSRIKSEEDLHTKSLKPVSVVLSKLLKNDVTFIGKTRGKELENAIKKMKSGDIILVENTRFEDYPEKLESSNDEELGKYWASLGDVFINDAFGTIHRAHASNVGIASNIESGIGFLVEKELTALKELNSPEKPFIVILGGAKVDDKIGVIKNLVKKCDKILIGGGMAFTFLQAEGYDIGTSIISTESIDFCKKLLKKYPDKLILPVDVVTTTEYKDTTTNNIRSINEINYNEMGLDIGPDTIKLFNNYLKSAKIVFWNGPLGVYEFKNYKTGTDKVLSYLTSNNIKTILGGGDIVAAASNFKDKIYHISTGGGATLLYLEGKKLPGLEVLK